MTSTIIILAIVALAAIGACIVLVMKIYSLSSSRTGMDEAEARLRAEAETRRLEELESRHKADIAAAETRHQADTAAAEARHRAEINELRQRHREEAERSEQRFKEMTATIKSQNETLNERNRLELQNFTNELLRRQQESLKQQNSEQLGTLLNPLSERIKDFNDAVSEYYMKERAGQENLSRQIDRMLEANNTIGEEARNLTNALRKDAQAAGAWGESLLTELLESCGLVNGVHFETQVSRDASGQVLREEDGKGRRIDVLINLPEGRKIIIDSKVSLSAYLDYTAAETPEAKSDAATRLVRSVNSHIDEIVKANYPKLIQGSLSQVIMFMPVEGAFFLAMDTDRHLPARAAKAKVSIVSPTHLHSLLMLIDQMWSVENQNRNTALVAEKANDICNKANLFLNNFTTLQKSIDSLQKAYDDCKTNLTGRGGLVKKSIDLKKMGIKPKNQIPLQLEEAAERTAELTADTGLEPDTDQNPIEVKQVTGPLDTSDR